MALRAVCRSLWRCGWITKSPMQLLNQRATLVIGQTGLTPLVRAKVEVCSATDITGTYYPPDSEDLALKCRPFYIPTEFTAVLIRAVYIPPQANAKQALEELHTAMSSQLNAYPEGIVIVAGDFNHVDLNVVLPKFSKNISFPTRDTNTLDEVHTNISGAYKASPSPHLGMSEHISLDMFPAYRPFIHRVKPTVRQMQVWSEEAASMLTTRTGKFSDNPSRCFLITNRGWTVQCGRCSRPEILLTRQVIRWPTVMPRCLKEAKHGHKQHTTTILAKCGEK